MNKYTETITGDGKTLRFEIQHNLNTKDVVVHVRDSKEEKVFLNETHPSDDVVVLECIVAPAKGEEFHVVVMG